jgi:hypothetical protein
MPKPTKNNPFMPKGSHIPEWYVSSFMMQRTLDEVVRRVKKLDRLHDVPYLAGYSKDGRTIYIDRHMPKSFIYRGRRIGTDKFLILHEAVEKALIDRLGLNYLHAHQIATRAEQAAVRATGISWHAYDRFMQANVKRIGDERLEKVPADLDLKPYRDEHDDGLVRQMLRHLDTGRHRLGFRAFRVRDRSGGPAQPPAGKRRAGSPGKDTKEAGIARTIAGAARSVGRVRRTFASKGKGK